MSEQHSPQELRWQGSSMQTGVVRSILRGHECASELSELTTSEAGRAELDGLLASAVQGFRARLRDSDRLDARTDAALDAIVAGDKVAVFRALRTNDRWAVDELIEDLIGGARIVLADAVDKDDSLRTVADMSRAIEADATKGRAAAQRRARQRRLAQAVVEDSTAAVMPVTRERRSGSEPPLMDSLVGLAMLSGLTHAEIGALHMHILGRSVGDVEALGRALKIVGEYFERCNAVRGHGGPNAKEYRAGYSLATYIFGIGWDRAMDKPLAMQFMTSAIRRADTESQSEAAIAEQLEASLKNAAFAVLRWAVENDPARGTGQTVKQILTRQQEYRKERQRLGDPAWS
jgi:hypothetical protein